MADTATSPETSAAVLGSYARIPTEKARTYLSQLCKHFGHKLPTTLTPTHGRVVFNDRIFEGDASQPGVLTLSVQAPTYDALVAAEDIIDRHVRRFAFKEQLQIAWVRDLAR